MTTSSATARPHCARCAALLAPTDRFCAVCGTPRPESSSRKPPRRGILVLTGAGGFLLVILAAVAWVYFNAPERRADLVISRIVSPQALAIRPGSAGQVYAVSQGDLLVSADQGASWKSAGLAEGVTAVAAALDGSRVYVAGAHWWVDDGSGLRETDSDLPAASIRALAVDPAEPRRLFAMVEGKGVFTSADEGKHWMVFGPNPPAALTSLTGGPGRLLFAGTDGHGVFASADGQEWPNANGFVNGALPTSHIRAIAFDPNSGDRYVAPTGETLNGALFVGTDRGLYKSIDSGISWSAQPFRQPIAALAVDPSGTRRMLVIGTDGSVYRIQG